MWLQQAESISQEEGDIPNKIEKEKEEDTLQTVRMTLSMMFLRSSMDMVKVRLENLDYAKTEDIG